VTLIFIYFSGLSLVQTYLIGNINNRPNVTVNTIIILSTRCEAYCFTIFVIKWLSFSSTSGVTNATAIANALKATGAVVLTIAVGTSVDSNILGQLASTSNYVLSIQNINDAASGNSLADNVYTKLMSSKQMFLNTASELMVPFFSSKWKFDG
jgi:hypothetical protein